MQLVERLGNETVVRVRLADGAEVTAALAGQHDLAPGQAIALGAVDAEIHLFDAAGLRL